MIRLLHLPEHLLTCQDKETGEVTLVGLNACRKDLNLAAIAASRLQMVAVPLISRSRISFAARAVSSCSTILMPGSSSGTPHIASVPWDVTSPLSPHREQCPVELPGYGWFAVCIHRRSADGAVSTDHGWAADCPQWYSQWPSLLSTADHCLLRWRSHGMFDEEQFQLLPFEIVACRDLVIGSQSTLYSYSFHFFIWFVIYSNKKNPIVWSTEFYFYLIWLLISSHFAYKECLPLPAKVKVKPEENANTELFTLLLFRDDRVQMYNKF